MTFAIFVVMLIYATIKAIQMYEHHNPQVSQYTEKTVFDFNEKLDLNEINFRLAFTVEGYHSREQKNDPRYVKYLVRIFGIHNGKEYERFIPFHNCTEEDWEQFPPVQKASADAISAIRSDPKRGMFCLDWDSQDILIYGNERNDEYQRIELVMTPCNYLHTHLGYKGDQIHPECVEDLDVQTEYLGPLDFVLYHTEDIFVPNGFDENSIKSQSVV